MDKAQAYFWGGRMIFIAPTLTNTPHVHFPASLYIAYDRPCTVTVTGADPVQANIVLTAPNTEQAIDSHGGAVLDLLIDADDTAFAPLAKLLGAAPLLTFDADKLAGLEDDLTAARSGNLDCRAAGGLFVDIITALAGEAPVDPPPMDPRIAAAASQLREQLADPPAVADLAARAGLSESRFMHLFKEQMAVPFRQYVLWQRLRAAVQAWSEGKSMTEIAHEAGFYDSAHFTRTVRKMLDYQPSNLADPDQVQFHNCACTPAETTLTAR